MRAEFEWTLSSSSSSSFFVVHPVVSPSLFSRGRLLATRLPPLCRSLRSHPLPTDDRPFCLARPRSTLQPVIKQPRGGQIESVEETRERRRRGDGQLAATMVSIVKGPSRRSRVGIGARPKPDRMRDKMRGRSAGGESPGLQGARWTDTSWSGNPPTPPRARGEFGLWTAAHRVVLPPASLPDDVALTPRPL